MTSVFRCCPGGAWLPPPSPHRPTRRRPCRSSRPPRKRPRSQTRRSQTRRSQIPRSRRTTRSPTRLSRRTTKRLVVVSGSRTEQKLVNAPATMSVITAAQIENVPTQNFAELLRAVPGVNITQVSARDINVTSRGATGTLATGQLALLDGRSLYQDFFGFVMWDFLPVNLNEVKQIEVIRGPASAVWGANALNGVVNVITKSPREMQGTSAVFGFGMFDRPDDRHTRRMEPAERRAAGTSAARTRRRSTTAGPTSCRPAATRRIRSRVRPAPSRARSDVCGPTRLSYPGFANTGTTQPKFDTRVDYDYPGRQEAVVLGRRRRHRGDHALGHRSVRHRQRLDDGLRQGRTSRSQGFRAAVFTNVLDGDATNLLTRTPTNAGRSASSSAPRPSTSRRRTCTRSASATCSTTAATCASTSSTSSSRRTPTTEPSSGSTCRTRSSSPIRSACRSAPASIASTISTSSCSRRAPPCCSSRRRTTPSGSRTTAPIARRR